MATAAARRGVASALHRSSAARLIQTGVGPLDPDRLNERLRHACGVVSIGTCGGISPRVEPGMLVLPRQLSSTSHADLDADAGWHARVYAALKDDFDVDTGTLITVERVLRSPEDKRRLHDRTHAVAVDMESIDLARAAGSLGIPCIALRVVLDTHDETVPASVASGVDRDGNSTPLQLLRTLARRPGDVTGLLRLAARLRSANAGLANACELARDALIKPRSVG